MELLNVRTAGNRAFRGDEYFNLRFNGVIHV